MNLFLRVITIVFFTSVFLFTFNTQGNELPVDPPSETQEADDDDWAPKLRVVNHPTTLMPTLLELILETPTKAFYEQKSKPKPPMKSVCQLQPDICIIERDPDSDSNL